MRVTVLVTSVLVVALAACSSDSKDADSNDTATTTTLAPAAAAQAYVPAGPHPVGITTLELEDGVQVEVWYPAVPGTTGKDAYNVRELVPESVKNLLTADVPAVYEIDAGRDADVAEGTFPLVLFSHGFTGIRQQSSFLTSHMASWGMIVAAPDHWSRDLYHVLGGVLGEPRVDANDSVDDLRQASEVVQGDARFQGHVDTEQVAAVGHSAGGGTVVGIADDPEIDGYVSMASGFLRGGGGSTTSSVAPPALPDKPSLFVAGANDQVASLENTTRPAFEAAPVPTRLWAIDKAGHNAFDDFCTFGDGKGIIGVAEASGLGGFLDAQPQFRRLGEDGCLPPNVPVADTFPIIRHVVVSWLRNLFGIDPTPVGLGPEVEGQYAVPVEIRERLS